MQSLSDLIQMGGYGGYVWPAYGLGILILAAVLAASLSGARSAEAELDALQRTRRDRRAETGKSESETTA